MLPGLVLTGCCRGEQCSAPTWPCMGEERAPSSGSPKAAGAVGTGCHRCIASNLEGFRCSISQEAEINRGTDTAVPRVGC